MTLPSDKELDILIESVRSEHSWDVAEVMIELRAKAQRLESAMRNEPTGTIVRTEQRGMDPRDLRRLIVAVLVAGQEINIDAVNQALEQAERIYKVTR